MMKKSGTVATYGADSTPRYDAAGALEAALDTPCTMDFAARVIDPRVITKGNGLDLFYGLLEDKALIEDPEQHPPHLKRLEWFAEALETHGCVTPRIMMELLAEREHLF